MDCVVVTGAAGGIGQALIKAFADAGYGVIGLDRVPVPAGCPVAHYIECDLARLVADSAYAEGVLAHIKERIAGRPLAGLINNAAIQLLGDMETLGAHDWRDTLDTNLIAPFLLSQALLHELEIAKGCILNISSIHARLTKPGFIAYATSKAALSGMTRAMAVEIGARVRVNAIEPAAIDTPMLQAGFADDPEGYARLKAFHPSRSIGSPDGLARLALAVVEMKDAFAGGSILSFDGGIGAALRDPGY